MKHNVNQLIEQELGDEGVPAEHWRDHLDTFLTAFRAEDPEYDWTVDNPGTDQWKKKLRVAFLYWMDNIKDTLVQDLPFRDEVDKFMRLHYAVDSSEWWPLPGMTPERGDEPGPDDPTISPDRTPPVMPAPDARELVPVYVRGRTEGRDRLVQRLLEG